MTLPPILSGPATALLATKQCPFCRGRLILQGELNHGYWEIACFVCSRVAATVDAAGRLWQPKTAEELGHHYDPREGAIPQEYCRVARKNNAKLTADDVREIRHRRSQGATLQSLGNAYGVSATTIRAIFTGRTWKDAA